MLVILVHAEMDIAAFWRIFGGIVEQVGEDLRETHAVGLNVDFLVAELDFDAIHPAFSYAQNRDGCPAWLADDSAGSRPDGASPEGAVRHRSEPRPQRSC